MSQTPRNYTISTYPEGTTTSTSFSKLVTYPVSQEVTTTPITPSKVVTYPTSYQEVTTIPITSSSVVTYPTSYKEVTTTTTPLSPSRLGAYGVSSWLSTDLDKLYAQYPQLFSKDDALKGRLSLHSNVINENIDLRSQIAALQKENESLKLSTQRTTDSEVRISALLADNQNTAYLLSEKSKECESWKSKFTAADAEAHNANVKISVLTNENQRLVQLVSATKEQTSSYELLRVQLAHLQTEYNSVTQTRDQLILANQERERQTAIIIAERERTIAELSARVNSTPQTVFVESEETRRKIAFYASENERLNAMVVEQRNTIDGLRVRINQVSQFEANLAATSEENARLRATLSQKLAEIETLKSRSVDYSNWEVRVRNAQADKDQMLATLSEKVKIIDSLKLQVTNLQVELSKTSDYRSKINTLLAENERLNNLLINNVKVIDEWATRYASLEKLYLSIKETTEQLDFVKRKYETAVNHHEKRETKLRQSVELANSNYRPVEFNNSRAVTEASSPRIYYNTKII